MPIRIVIFDDHTMFRESITAALAREPDLEVVGQSGDGKRGIELVIKNNPNVILLDVEIAGSSIGEIIEEIHCVSPSSKIAILAMHEDSELAGRLMDSGVDAFISKGSSLAELLAAIRSIASGHDMVVLSVSRDVLSGLRESGRNLLSAREIEVLTLVSQGFGNAQIAAQLFISEGTVKRHLTNIYGKLGVQSRVNAINRATRLGILRPSLTGDPRHQVAEKPPNGRADS